MFWTKWTESLIKDKTVQDQDNTNFCKVKWAAFKSEITLESFWDQLFVL